MYVLTQTQRDYIKNVIAGQYVSLFMDMSEKDLKAVVNHGFIGLNDCTDDQLVVLYISNHEQYNVILAYNSMEFIAFIQTEINK